MSDILEQARETFISESLELLQEMEDALTQLEAAPDDEELINSVFRAAHTIKGSAGLFGLEAIVEFTHKVENVLDRVRAGKVSIHPRLIEALLDCRDHTELLIEHIDEDSSVQAADRARSQALLTQLEGHTQGAAPSHKTRADQPATGVPSQDTPIEYQPRVDREESLRVESDNWHISLRFHPDVLRNGMDPLSFLRYLTTLGEIVNVITLTDALPSAEAMDPETCYLGLEIAFNSAASKPAIMEVFEFIAEESQICILPPNSRISEYAELIEKLAHEEPETKIGELLIAVGALSEHELAQALKRQQQAQSSNDPGKPVGEILVDQGSLHPQTLDKALSKQQNIKTRKGKESRSIRVDAERLDQLINLVGELVIAGAGTNLLAKQLGDEALSESVSLISRLVEEIRDRSLRLRMVQIGETFNRFNRVVRDVSRDINKSIKLEIAGSDTELDKGVVEKIGDPLTHLVRNAIDHGIESPDVRRASGKPEEGRVRLDAYHDSGSIVIEVSDDGGGIDPDKILAKARANGLVGPDQQPSRAETLRLILEAGLSTKEQVSDLSGRGVGMDVVKRNVEALRGSIEVDSELGQGTTIRVRLPLTLSIIDGFLVGIGDSSYVIPLDSVVECIEQADPQEYGLHHGNYLNLRGEVLPFLNLRELFEEQGPEAPRTNIVVVKYAGQKAGLVVDNLMGEHQTVIKPLNKIFARLSGISGSTILGSGEVAMILDVSALVQQAEQQAIMR